MEPLRCAVFGVVLGSHETPLGPRTPSAGLVSLPPAPTTSAACAASAATANQHQDWRTGHLSGRGRSRNAGQVVEAGAKPGPIPGYLPTEYVLTPDISPIQPTPTTLRNKRTALASSPPPVSLSVLLFSLFFLSFVVVITSWVGRIE